MVDGVLYVKLCCPCLIGECVYSVSVAEMQSRLEFDIDSNGEVSEDEAKVTELPTFFFVFLAVETNY